MGKVPERIWLQIDTDPESEWYDEIIVTWCADQINDDDIEYVLATRISELEVENADLKETIEIHDMNFTMLLEKSAIRASELKSDLEVEEKLTEYYADKAEKRKPPSKRRKEVSDDLHNYHRCSISRPRWRSAGYQGRTGCGWYRGRCYQESR